MKVLLDTRVLIWLANGDEARLARRAKAVFASAEEMFFSIASYWELCIKRGLGKLEWNSRMGETFERGLRENGIANLPLTHAHCETVVTLPQLHRDPFNRILIAQAMVEGLAILTADEQFQRYQVKTIL